jgi:hypothetical protein
MTAHGGKAKEVVPRVQRGESMYRERIKNLRAAVMQTHNPYRDRSLTYIQWLMDQSVAYVESVLQMESRAEILKFRLEPEDYRAAIAQLDSRRRSIHDALISTVFIVNRICDKLSLERVYQSGDNRYAIAQFAFDLVYEFHPEKSNQ